MVSKLKTNREENCSTTQLHSEDSERQQTNIEIESLVESILSFGDLLLVANKGCGKTNALMCIAQAFRNVPNTKVVIFEDFPKFALEFDSIPFFIVKDEDITEYSHVIDTEDYFLRHERSYSVNRFSEIQQFLDSNKDVIFVSEIADIERTCFFIYRIVDYYYRKAYLRKYKGYSKMERVVFVIEESQNVFDSSTVSKAIFNRLRKIFSVARNLDLHFVLASQRLQDLNTKIRGRTRLLIGSVSLDDYELKIERLLRNSKYKEEILNFQRGEFLFTATDTKITFPKFTPNGKPTQWFPKVSSAVETQSETLPTKQNFLDKIATFLIKIGVA